MPTSLMIVLDDNNNSDDVEPVPDDDPCSGHNLFQGSQLVPVILMLVDDVHGACSRWWTLLMWGSPVNGDGVYLMQLGDDLALIT